LWGLRGTAHAVPFLFFKIFQRGIFVEIHLRKMARAFILATLRA
jgi:hypothetical protein